MRRVVNCGRVDRLLGAGCLAVAFAAGCSTAPAPPVVAVAPTAAAQPAVDNAEPAAENVAPISEAVAETSVAAEPVVRESAKPVVEGYAAEVPPVVLSAGHRKLCRVFVGDSLPPIELPQLGGASASVESLAGSKATVVLFWTADAWMSETALRDLQRDVATGDVAVVGVAVRAPADAAQKSLAAAGAKFPQMIDAEGAALAQVGDDLLPRIYVIDAQRRVAWFDVEYSEATRRELQQTLAALTGGDAQ